MPLSKRSKASPCDPTPFAVPLPHPTPQKPTEAKSEAFTSHSGVEVTADSAGQPAKVKTAEKPRKRKKKPLPELPPAQVPRIILPRPTADGGPPLVSELDPTKRTLHWKRPTPDSKWRKQWKLRKKTPGTSGALQRSAHLKALEEALGVGADVFEDFPRDEEGAITCSDELMAALCAYLEQGGTRYRFAVALGISAGALYVWAKKPRYAADVTAAIDRGCDALADKALIIATEPVEMEDVYESYDGAGNLQRRDVKRGDAAYARKLAVTGIMNLLAKWAPERYGEKPQTKTTESMAQRILAARRRVSPQDSE